MDYYQSIEPYYIDKNKLSGDILDHTEMTRDEIAFLCGLIRDYKPQKIVEVGVAAGATTAIILCCLDLLKIKSEVYSVDLCEQLYYEKGKKTGYVGKKYIEEKPHTVHRFMLGHYLAEQLDDIGRGIDLVILDTVHHLPGELLDFLAVLPFLKSNAIVVLHDVALEHSNSKNDPYCYSNQILFSSVSARKFLNNSNKYPNIAAFQIDQTTRDNIADVFSALTLSWTYLPEENELEIYRKFYEKYYSSDLIAIFDQAVRMNMNSAKKINSIVQEYFESLNRSLLSCYDHIILYGAGKRGKCINKVLNEFLTETNKVEFVVSDYEEANRIGCLSWDSIDYLNKETLIILSANSDEIRSILNSAKCKWIDIPEYVWYAIERVFDGEIND